MTVQKSVTVVALTHDLIRKRSIVTVIWDDDAEKRIALPVPFACDLNSLRAEAEKAVRELSAEMASITVNAPK
jgi:hypothetical protein